MSSRFVSAGVVDASGVVDESKAEAKTETAEDQAELTARQAEWRAVERRLDEERKKREAARAAAATPSSSLYDMLQANKDAKQAAFEEAAKLSNQFRALDEDEIEFLDSLKERERAEAERVQRETAEGIEAFRKAQTTGGDAESAADAGTEDISWSIRKRKRAERTGFPKLKRRADDSDSKMVGQAGQNEKKKSETEVKTGKTIEQAAKDEAPAKKDTKPKEPSAPAPPQAAPKPPAKPKLLVAYDSDSGSGSGSE